MKKKIVVVVAMSCVLAMGLITGCGNKETAAPTTVATTVDTEAKEETKAVEETAAETKAAEETKEEAAKSAKSGDYLSWTASEWTAASDDDKAAATKMYLIETTKATSKAMGQEFTSQMEAAITDNMVKASIVTLDTAFAADPNMKLQDILDATNEAAAMMGEMATQPAQ